MFDKRGAIFDLDGTLLDSLSIWEQIDIRFLEKRGIEIPPDYTRTVSQLGYLHAAKYTIKEFGLDATPEDLIREWNEMSSLAYAQEIRLKPGAAEYLIALREAGIRLGIATALNADRIIDVLNNNGVYSYFDSFTTLEEVNRPKEFPDIYLREAEKLHLPPSDIVVYEDILPGIRGAKAGGFTVCGVFDPYTGDDWPKITRIADRILLDYRDFLPNPDRSGTGSTASR